MVFSLDELMAGFFPTARTGYVGLLGYPLSGTLSPKLQNVAFRAMGLDNFYLPIEVQEEERFKAIFEHMPLFGFVGTNVTMPWKEKVIELLDELDESASLCGAVNTVKFDGGRAIGYNTDGVGFVTSFVEAFGESPRGKSMLMLGAGGAARAVAFYMLREGISRLVVVNRSADRARALVENLRSHFPGRVELMSMEDGGYRRRAREFDVIVNTTSVGMYKDPDSTLLIEEDFREGQLVCDVVYNPPKTRMLKEAERAGARVLSGRGMVVHQAAKAFEIWTGVKPDVSLMFSVFDRHFGVS